jgi:cytoskeleton protein RodZ
MTSLGQDLKEEREARNISIEEIASATKIVPRYIEALENDRFDIMPGGFFIKGIIRTYARAIGLNEEDVLARYRAAGVFGEPDRKRSPAPKPEPPPPARLSPIPAPDTPIPPAPSPSPDTTQILVPEMPPAEPLILAAPKPRLTPEARKRIVRWFGGGAIVVLVIAVFILLWPFHRARPSPVENNATLSVAAPAVVPPPQKPEPEPVAEEVWTGVTIEISFQAETWIQVYTDGVLKIEGLFPPGAKAKAQAAEKLLIHVGNAGGFTFLLNGKPAKPLGRAGQVITDIKITPDNLKDFLQAETTGQPTG